MVEEKKIDPYKNETANHMPKKKETGKTQKKARQWMNDLGAKKPKEKKETKNEEWKKKRATCQGRQKQTKLK